jgi:Cof subfamily protein (haloacid dehalogenase superfamily)
MHITPPDIKLLVIDIDGTLLTPGKQITARTRTAIHAAQKEGIVVTLATGRRYINTGPIADALGLSIPLILCDGALVLQHPQVTVLHTQLLASDVAQAAVEILARNSIQPVVHHLNGAFEEVWTGRSEFDSPWIENYFSTFPRQITRLPLDTLCAGKPDPIRVVAFASEEDIYHLASEISTLDCSWNTIQQGNYGSAELAIMHRHCSKASGVSWLAQSLGIPMADVMAIGDNNNDLEMLKSVGWGVAMGQASDAVKSMAHAVTTSNTEEGVALAIERYALCRVASADSNSFSRTICL